MIYRHTDKLPSGHRHDGLPSYRQTAPIGGAVTVTVTAGDATDNRQPQKPMIERKIPLTGHAGMIRWNPTWRGHHLPVPFKVRIRRAAIAAETWRPRMSSHTDGLCWPLWDHWGSVILDGDTERSLITQPYGICDTEARDFATRHGLQLTMRCTAPWAPGATFYAFSIPQT